MAAPAWITDMQAVATVVGAVCIAGGSFFIARKQAHIAAQKLRLDLFEKRFKVYEAVHNAIIDLVYLDLREYQSKEEVIDQHFKRVRAMILQARFLFEAEVLDFLVDVELSMMVNRSGRHTFALSEEMADEQKRAGWGDDQKALAKRIRDENTKLMTYAELLPKMMQAELQIDENSKFSLASITRSKGRGSELGTNLSKI